MTTPRTLDSMYGTGITPDEAPHVERTVDGEDYSVDVDLTPAATTLLETLAHAIHDDGRLRTEWSNLAWDGLQGDRRDLAMWRLVQSPKVRQALTIRLRPDTAEFLGHDLDDASIEPERCDQYDHGDHCQHYAAEGETQCPRHLPANPQP